MIIYKSSLRNSNIFTLAGLRHLLLEMHFPALENKRSDATDVEGMQRYFKATWLWGSIWY